mmetsp:Transcript_175745/g.427409  ORF Transcript_175745/g.427409 Transcript_175745/m.427409 type:complete len:263 (+) Transcript_175745:44-832(+)
MGGGRTSMKGAGVLLGEGAAGVLQAERVPLSVRGLLGEVLPLTVMLPVRGLLGESLLAALLGESLLESCVSPRVLPLLLSEFLGGGVDWAAALRCRPRICCCRAQTLRSFSSSWFCTFCLLDSSSASCCCREQTSRIFSRTCVFGACCCERSPPAAAVCISMIVRSFWATRLYAAMRFLISSSSCCWTSRSWSSDADCICMACSTASLRAFSASSARRLSSAMTRRSSATFASGPGCCSAKKAMPASDVFERKAEPGRGAAA